MEKVENPTAIRVKNSFSIENILSRPDNSDNQRKLIRQNPFQNNHVLFYENSDHHELSGRSSAKILKKDKIDNHENSLDKTDSENQDTFSEAASDDGNSSVHSKFLIFERY